jgi:hypothetical protein
MHEMNNDLNSIFTWYPLIKDVVPTPDTTLIPQYKKYGAAKDHPFKSLDDALLYKKPSTDPGMRYLVNEACRAAHLYGYPVFIKSDQLANKHDWIDSCFVTSDEQMEAGIKNIVEFTMMLMMGPDFRGLAVRRFIELDWKFHAFNGMPVAREFRFFIKNGDVQCWHPYWFPAALRNIDDEDWMPKLREIQKLSSGEHSMLVTLCKQISHAVEPLGAKDNYWSIDWCQSKEGALQNPDGSYSGGRWYMTDMATGENSFHYTSCEFAPPEMKAEYGDMDDLSDVYTMGQMSQKRKAIQERFKE